MRQSPCRYQLSEGELRCLWGHKQLGVVGNCVQGIPLDDMEQAGCFMTRV